MLSNENPLVLTDYGFYVTYTNLFRKYMIKVKTINFNESGFIKFSMSNAIELVHISPLRLCILSDLYYLNARIHEKSENEQFQ